MGRAEGASLGLMMGTKLPVSVVVPTRNEEKNIAHCLESVQWADEVFVVDSSSSDDTREISEFLGATVVQFDYSGGWPKKKNWALRNLQFRNEWILILDADERVDNALRQEIESAIRMTDVNGFYVRWKFIFLGRWMKHCWRHGWMLRLFRHGTGEYEDLGMRDEGGWDNEVHENIVVAGKTAQLKSWLTHDSQQSVSEWLTKQNQFSEWNAVRRTRQESNEAISPRSLVSKDVLVRRKALKSLFLRMPWKPQLMFVYLYLFRLGFLDGREGYYFCSLRAAHELNIEIKQFEAALSQRQLPDG